MIYLVKDLAGLRYYSSIAKKSFQVLGSSIRCVTIQKPSDRVKDMIANGYAPL